MIYNYIQAPYEPQSITILKGKAEKISRAKRKEVPVDYRKNRFAKFKSQFRDVMWNFKQIRKEMKHHDY